MKINQDTKAAIRQAIRLERAKLSLEGQIEKSKKLTGIVIQLPEFLNSQHIAGYWPNDNEISVLDILAIAHKLGKTCYLPRLDPGPTIQMQFVEYHPGDTLAINQLGILEPMPHNKKTLPAELLDLVLVPLIAFDTYGRRLGMGKGYYDHTFAFHQTDPKTKPFLLGVAYDLQKTESLPSETWDVLLDGIVTENQQETKTT